MSELNYYYSKDQTTMNQLLLFTPTCKLYKVPLFHKCLFPLQFVTFSSKTQFLSCNNLSYALVKRNSGQFCNKYNTLKQS